jgi:hypothetical protein
VPLALRASRRRRLTWAFGGALVLTWVLMLDAVITTGWIRDLFLRVPFGDVYLHNPGRMRYLAIIAVPVLGAAGLQGLRDEPLSARALARWLGAGAFFWLGVPLVAFADPRHFVVLLVGLVAGAWALWKLVVERPRWAPAAVAGVLALELVISAVLSHRTSPGDTVHLNLEAGEHPNLVPQPLPLPRVDASAFVTPTTFVRRLRATRERYLTWAPPASSFEKGYLFMQLAPDWPALAMERGTLFGVHDPLGYNPVQLPRYWSYIRARSRLPIFYNASVIDVPIFRDARLLGVRYIVTPTGIGPPLDGRVVDRAQGYDLFEVAGWQPRASVVPAWRVIPSVTGALRTILPTTFDPARLAVLESDPGIVPVDGADPGRASYRELSPEHVELRVEADAPSIVVVRTTYDDGWSASVDGRPARVLPVDGFLQGVAVPAGSHEVRLVYEDEAISRGITAGFVAWGGLAAGLAVIWSLERARAPRPAGPRSRPAGAGGP